MSDPLWVILFDSIHYVLAAEQVFQQHAVWCDLIPVPRDLHSDCGMVVAFRAEDRPAVDRLLAGPRFGRRRVYQPSDSGWILLETPSGRHDLP